MTVDKKDRKKKSRRIQNTLILIVILIFLAGIPLAVLHYQARKTGMTLSEVIHRKISPKTTTSDTLNGALVDSTRMGQK